jgi:hypothetical protein
MADSPKANLDAEAVTWAYRLLLGREPESQAAIEHHLTHCGSLSMLRQVFMSSEEYKLQLSGFANFYETRDDVKHLAEFSPRDKVHGHVLRDPTKARKQVGGAFYRGENCNFWPTQEDFENSDFIETFVLKGWMPETPQINSSTKVTTFGSCFAVSIANHLSKLGYNLSRDRDPGIYISRMSEGLVNIHALLQQFEWALEDKTPPENLWHGFDAEDFGYSDEVKIRTRSVFLDTDFFIVTLGLSEVWFDEATGGVLWRAVPRKKHDPTRHRFRMCSVEETKLNLGKIYDIIRTHVPKAKILFTLSPIPLAATFRPVGSVTANSASKSILRSALDEFFRERADAVNRQLFYFPSYEIANELFPERFEQDFRHPRLAIVDFIMQTFEGVYCEGGKSLLEINRRFHELRRADRTAV